MSGSFDTRFALSLEDRIRQVQARCGDEIAAGAVTDWADYRARVGYMRALSDILDAMQDIEDELQGRTIQQTRDFHEQHENH